MSVESGIPTFRGQDGYWTVGSKNYTPQQMATRAMYQQNPAEFLKWYYQRFVTYRHLEPNPVHRWLSDKNLITQNIDGLDVKAGNRNVILVHGQIDQVTLFQGQFQEGDILSAPWDEVDETNLESSLLELFKISKNGPEPGVSLKPYVLLFDEHYTDLYRISEARERMHDADEMVFMGTSFSVNITRVALDTAMYEQIPVVVVDPNLNP